MANRKRNIQMKFYVTEDEKRLIDEKMALLPTLICTPNTGHPVLGVLRIKARSEADLVHRGC